MRLLQTHTETTTMGALIPCLHPGLPHLAQEACKAPPKRSRVSSRVHHEVRPRVFPQGWGNPVKNNPMGVSYGLVPWAGQYMKLILNLPPTTLTNTLAASLVWTTEALPLCI